MLLLSLSLFGFGLVDCNIVFVILDQTTPYHKSNADNLASAIENQSENLDIEITIFRLSSAFSHVTGGWTFWPVANELLERIDIERFKWIFVCEDETFINIAQLKKLLHGYNAADEVFLAYALRDRHPTIIHHYAFVNDPTKFAYPDFARGFVLSMASLIKLNKIVQDPNFKFNFAIDAKHELAMMLWDNGQGSTMIHNENFCLKNSSECISSYQPSQESCRFQLSIGDNFYVAVKTYQKFHRTRIPVVKNTWAKNHEEVVEYFSDSNDPDIPTVKVKVRNTDRDLIFIPMLEIVHSAKSLFYRVSSNLKNGRDYRFIHCPCDFLRSLGYERGHCGKTFIIMSRFVENYETNKNRWLIIVDDDTLISLERLVKLLKCYDLRDNMIVGERYGFGFSATGDRGYDYPTGGSGMVFSPTAVKLLTEKCNCPSLDSPDDMIIGMCARTLGISIIHNAAFHQARPDDYSSDYIARLEPISFHKHYEIDPYDVYREYLFDNTTEINKSHDEF